MQRKAAGYRKLNRAKNASLHSAFDVLSGVRPVIPLSPIRKRAAVSVFPEGKREAGKVPFRLMKSFSRLKKEGQPSTLTDPFGRKILLPAFPHGAGHQPESPDAYRKAVETPACMIEESPDKIYYFHSLAWNYTILVEAVCRKGMLTVTGCTKNPEPESIQALLKDGVFIAAGSLNQTL